MAQRIERQVPWSLFSSDENIETELLYYEGLLPATNVEESGETGLYASLGIPGRRLPITQYVRGETQTFSFEAFYINDPTVAKDGRHTVTRARNLLKKMVAPHRALARPPKYSFSLGEDGGIGFECFVESIGSISYSDLITGYNEPLHASFSIRLRIIADAETDTSAQYPQAKEPQAHLAKYGETHEEIGAKKYGDPMMGVVLRQQGTVAFPGSIPREKVQDRTVKLLDSWSINKFSVAPMSPALQLTRADTAAAFYSLYAFRNNQLRPSQPPGAAAIQRFQLPTP